MSKTDPRVFLPNFDQPQPPGAFPVAPESRPIVREEGGYEPKQGGGIGNESIDPGGGSIPGRQAGEGRQARDETVERNKNRQQKPHAFALAHGIGGASIWHGCLLSSRTIITVTKMNGKGVIVSQAPIPKVEYMAASNLDTDLLRQTHLGWYGNVYGKWEADEDGLVSGFEIVGPDEPTGIDIGELDTDQNRSPTEGTYFVLIGTVDENSPVDQKVSSDIPWFVTILKSDGGGSPSYQWHATKASPTTLNVKGGVLTSQAGFAVIDVADVAGLSATASGYTILTISRDSSTRAVSGTPTISYAAGTLPESDYTDQIVPLSKVTVTDSVISEILPLKFEELHIFEDMAVVNGEFKLADLLIAGRNIYDPPP